MRINSYRYKNTSQWVRTFLTNVEREKAQASPRESISSTEGEWFLKTLQALGVEYVFGTTGGVMPDIQDAMTEVKPPI